MANPFDQFDAPATTAQDGNPFDQFDVEPAVPSPEVPKKAKPGIPMLASHAAPTPTIKERVSGGINTMRDWAGSPTPESTGTGDFLTRVVPTSLAKNIVGIPIGTADIYKNMAKGYVKEGPIGVAKAQLEGGAGLLRGMSTAMGLRPPEEASPSGPARDYGVGLPASMEQFGARLKHQVRTNPVGVVGSVAMAKAAGKAAPGIAKSVAIPTLEGAAKAGGALATKLTDMTLKQKTTLKPEVRAQNVETAHKGGFLPTSKGVDNLASAITIKEGELARGIASGDAAQVKGTFDRSIANLESLREKANRSSDPVKNNALIDSEIAKLKENPLLDANGQVDIGTLQKMKVEQGQAIEPKYGQATPDAFQVKADKARIRGLKEELEAKLDDTFPELAATNKQLGQYYDLKRVLTKAANRIQNNQGIGIGLPIKSGAGAAIGGSLAGPVGAAIGGTVGTLIGIVEHPSVAPRLARQLYKVSKGAMSYADALKTTKARIADLAFTDFKAAHPETYEPSMRTPGEVAPIIEKRAEVGIEQPLEPTEGGIRHGELEIRPGFTGETPPAESSAAVMQKFGPGFPKAPPTAPQPGTGATLIDNRLTMSPQGAVYLTGEGTPSPRFSNTPRPERAQLVNPQGTISGYDLMDTAKGGGPGTRFMKEGNVYTVDQVMGGPEPVAIAYADGSNTPVRIAGTDIIEPVPASSIVNNASGESAASMKAINAAKSAAAQGIKYEIVDTRSGKARPAAGLQPEDNPLNPFEMLVQIKNGQRTVMGAGAKAIIK